MKIDLDLLLKLPELEITSVELTDQRFVVHCRSRFREALCPSCLRPIQEVKKYYTRTIRDLPITGREVSLALEERQFYCPDCERYFSERFSVVDPNRTTTTRYETYLFARCAQTPCSQVAVGENLAWSVVQAIYTRQAQQQLAPTPRVRWLGIDELALRKGHRAYVCVLVDLERGCVLDLLPHRTQEYLIAYFRQQGPAFCAGIEVFSCDRWDGFVTTAQTMFPNATIVIDRFHVMGQLHHALDQYRRRLRRDHPDVEALKGLRGILLKPADALTPAEEEQLQRAVVACPPLEQAWLVKESLRDWFDGFDTADHADRWLAAWIEHVLALENRYLAAFVQTLQRWRQESLAFFHQRITNGMVEGINNMIKAIKRRAYGYLNFEHFRLRVLVECR